MWRKKSAFPVIEDSFQRDGDATGIECKDPGMTLRDYFAGQALIGLISAKDGIGEDLWMDTISKRAYKLADCMIAEREKAE
jgi:hypothetical protein